MDISLGSSDTGKNLSERWVGVEGQADSIFNIGLYEK